jgi:formylglycine-generating enzyme required for sulfatase activity
MGKNRSRFQGDDNRPVETVSWEEVQMFLDKLNAMEDGKKYRLPTEAEWEYAARAGSTTAYSFGDDSSQLGKYAWFKDNAGNTTHPVGKLRPNAWGLYDIHGNVWEWVQDYWYGGTYAAGIAGPMADPQGPALGLPGSSEAVAGVTAPGTAGRRIATAPPATAATTSASAC